MFLHMPRRLARRGPMGETPARIGPVTAIGVRPVPLSQTWALRHAVLRPHETLEQVAAEDESADAFAVAAFEEGAEPVAVGLIAPTGVRGEWRIRGMATAPGSRGRGAGTA